MPIGPQETDPREETGKQETARSSQCSCRAFRGRSFLSALVCAPTWRELPTESSCIHPRPSQPSNIIDHGGSPPRAEQTMTPDLIVTRGNEWLTDEPLRERSIAVLDLSNESPLPTKTKVTLRIAVLPIPIKGIFPNWGIRRKVFYIGITGLHAEIRAERGSIEDSTTEESLKVVQESHSQRNAQVSWQ